MTISRHMRGGLLAAAVVLVASCGEPMQPDPSPGQGDLLSGLTTHLTGLIFCPMDPDSVTQEVGPAGGTIHFGPHWLNVPAGALSETVAITAVLSSQGVNEVRFQPEGLQFAEPAQLSMSYGDCPINILLPKRIAYTSDQLEILAYIPSVDHIFSRRVTGSVEHFSGYAVAW